MLIYEKEPKKMVYLESEYTSEKNPFLQLLSTLLINRFEEGSHNVDSDDTKKRITGFSPTSLARIFFKDDYLDTGDEVIKKLNIFCTEIEKEFKNPNKLSKKAIRIFLLIAFILFTLLGLKKCLNSDAVPNSTTTNVKANDDCRFISDSLKEQVLVLPFKLIDKKLGRGDVGYYIKERLDDLNRKDSLNMSIIFCQEFVPTNDSPEYFESIKAKYNANHMIYGFSNTAISEQGKFSFNYLTEFEQYESIKPNFVGNSYKDLHPTDLKQLSEGYLQGDLDFLIYWNAMLVAYNSGNFVKALSYSENLLKPSSNEVALIYLYRGLCYERISKDDLAIDSYRYALKTPSKYDSYLSQRLGYLSTLYNKNQQAKIYLKRALKTPRQFEFVVNSLYIVNDRLRAYNDNLLLLEEASIRLPNLDNHYKYLRFLTYKAIGNQKEYVRDSIKLRQRVSEDEFSTIPIHINELKMSFDINRNIKIDAIDKRIQFELIQPLKGQKLDSVFTDYQRIKKLYPAYYSENKKNIEFQYKGVLYQEGYISELLKKYH